MANFSKRRSSARFVAPWWLATRDERIIFYAGVSVLFSVVLAGAKFWGAPMNRSPSTTQRAVKGLRFIEL
ncbi:hypothetical protein [Microbacterium sp. SS28]|uniref:hypothetical protein n=1 Tax=Microbacterium sp. SS28 TaxID=2919948 RepID=UPI001FA9AF58|nr:hypothetical protein [Microbacterium sp. SS28]